MNPVTTAPLSGTRPKEVASVDEHPGSLSILSVRKAFGEGAARVEALKGVSLEVEAGEFVVVLGPSGSGKTTLLNIVGGIDAATNGSVLVDGEDIGSYGPRELTEYRRRVVGFVFQFFNLVPSLTALENVALIAGLTGANERSASAGDAAEARRALEAVGLADRLDHFPAALSGGEQQRVAIARALAKRPSLLLCDEPTGALDLETGRSVLALLREVNRERSLTTLLVTHNSAIAKMADRVVRVRDGRIEEDRLVHDPLPAEEVIW